MNRRGFLRAGLFFGVAIGGAAYGVNFEDGFPSPQKKTLSEIVTETISRHHAALADNIMANNALFGKLKAAGK